MQKRSIVEKCEDGVDCYIAAEIDEDLIGEEGYVFHIGDGEMYGGYLNRPLQQDTYYSASIAFAVFVPQVRNLSFEVFNYDMLLHVLHASLCA